MARSQRIGLVLLLAMLSVMSLDAAAVTHAADKPAVKWDDKKIPFEMRDQPWSKVIEWLSDQSKTPFVSKAPPPAGKFTFINPMKDGKPREYTLTEIHIILNDALIKKTKHVLVRQEKTLTLLPLK